MGRHGSGRRVKTTGPHVQSRSRLRSVLIDYWIDLETTGEYDF